MTSLYKDIMKSVQDSQNYVRTNQFKVVITPPAALQSSSVSMNRLTLNAKAAPIPGFALEEYSRSYGGEVPYHLANSLGFNELALQFYISKDFLEHQFFVDWRNEMVTDDSNRLGYYDDYKSPQIQVMPMSRSGDKILKVFEYRECTIKTVGDIDLNYSDENQLAILMVSFGYRNWKMKNSEE